MPMRRSDVPRRVVDKVDRHLPVVQHNVRQIVPEYGRARIGRSPSRGLCLRAGGFTDRERLGQQRERRDHLVVAEDRGPDRKVVELGFNALAHFERGRLTLLAQEISLFGEFLQQFCFLRFEFFDRYLIKGETPAQISETTAGIGEVWSRLVGASASSHYGRPYRFHHQAQRADWAAAWSRVRAPVLAMYGEYDWFESRDATSLIARIVNSRRPGRGTFVEIPRMNHHFSQFGDASHAFRETNGTVNPDPAVEVGEVAG